VTVPAYNGRIKPSEFFGLPKLFVYWGFAFLIAAAFTVFIQSTGFRIFMIPLLLGSGFMSLRSLYVFRIALVLPIMKASKKELRTCTKDSLSEW
jgi:hypothetical protein